MAALAYTRGRREINQYFSVSSAKGLALAAVLLLAAGHAALRHYPGHDSCEHLLSSGRFLGEKVWQPHSCMMHKYKVSEAKTCLLEKHVAFVGDSRIRQLFYSFVKIINPQFREEGNKHENIPFEDKTASLKVDFLWHPEVNASMKQRIKVWTESAMILMNVCCNKVVRPIDGSCCQPPAAPTLTQKLAAAFFSLSIAGCLVLHLVHRHSHRRSRPCADVEGGEEKKAAPAAPVSPSEVVLQSCCKLGLIMAYFYLCDRADLFMKENKFYTHSSFFTPIIYILVLGVFYNENTKETKMLNREQTEEWKGWMQLVILIYHISGASTFLPVYMHIRVLVAAYLFQTGYGHFSYFWIKGDFGIHRVCQVLFRLNFLVVVLCIVMDRPYQFYYFVPLVTVWFLVIYGTLALWPQITQKKANGNCFWHLGLLMKLASLLVCICFLAYSQGAFEKIFSLWPLSKCFELNGNVYEWWFRWKLDRYVVFHGMLFAFVYLALQKHQLLSEGKGEPLLPSRVANVLLFVSVVSFLTYSIWASSCKTKAECNELHPAVSVVQILAFILIRNIPGYARSVYSSFFAWFGKISLELFICQYHIWLAADTRGVLVLVPGSPALNITVSTFVFVCVAHEISRITNDLAHVLLPKESSALWKRLACIAAFFCALLLLSAVRGGR
ncbi:N-acetylneuraminate 9-O-acetyltransferase isoform X3 [Gracilinanus agilis]|uniref:N-acetylneuraminate 9-O-acetyltransferase isoform X3 n=1 Tax=Gracilinanus agilis TaxID=191870 RepID=UPI001CFF0A13|nr:N-acetylneuraminate 9-O-acetyltransferase isoform X3 [Gracilinanus agilis]